MTACPGVRVEDPDIKNALSNRPPYNPLPEMSEHVPRLMSADAPASVSFGCMYLQYTKYMEKLDNHQYLKK